MSVFTTVGILGFILQVININIRISVCLKNKMNVFMTVGMLGFILQVININIRISVWVV